MNWLLRLIAWLLPFVIVGACAIGLLLLGALALSLVSGKSVGDAFMGLVDSLFWN